jgi:hypothetical protein
MQDDWGYYIGYGCSVVTTGPELPVATAFTDQKEVDQDTAIRVAQGALAVGDALWNLAMYC